VAKSGRFRRDPSDGLENRSVGAHIRWMEKLVALTTVAAIAAFAAVYAVTAWMGQGKRVQTKRPNH
jgi:hypothetical protein